MWESKVDSAHTQQTSHGSIAYGQWFWISESSTLSNQHHNFEKIKHLRNLKHVQLLPQDFAQRSVRRDHAPGVQLLRLVRASIGNPKSTPALKQHCETPRCVFSFRFPLLRRPWTQRSFRTPNPRGRSLSLQNPRKSGNSQNKAGPLLSLLLKPKLSSIPRSASHGRPKKNCELHLLSCCHFFRRLLTPYTTKIQIWQST